ncbi:hypothetical protein KKC63_03250 [Patescibacteria group bacterium]|nr:hypothetical protein [Patescibacteria group bacterium]MBU4022856.1 hypothetical protein [Patescibacteria group bacterium]
MANISRKDIKEDFFKAWTPEMSYVLGYILADGCIIKRSGRKRSYVLNLTSKDKDLLLQVRKVLCPDCSILKKYSSSKTMCYQLQICSEVFYEDLIKLGIVPRKTYNLKGFRCPNKYFAHFVRGFFDGDGTVYVYKVNGTSQIKAGFTSGNFEFITEFNRNLCESLGISKKSIHLQKKTGKMDNYNICFYIDDCEKLAKLMYSDNPSIFLDRKRKVFQNWEFTKRRGYQKKNYPSKIGWHLNKNIAGG